MNVPSLVAGFVPVVAFLLGLRLMDSYKLVHRRTLLVTMAGGVAAALVAYALHRVLLDAGVVTPGALRAWIAPVLEEALKAALVVWLVQRDRVGFVVDAAVLGFAVGTGFALAENVYYARALGDSPLALWVVRGLGTAVMHGSATALFAILGKALSDRRESAGLLAFVPGMLVAVAVHAAYNQLNASPLVSTAALLVAMPLLLVAAFEYSERATREWLAGGFDGELQMLESMLHGTGRNAVGRYGQRESRFEPRW
jgi:RsiW-degrading membrane proteinase PrsW (M82 family)